MSEQPLDQLRFVTVADVYKAKRHAGTLTRQGDGSIRFAYSPTYQGAPIAVSLPLGDAPPPRSGLPPFFAGLLPEGHRLTVLRHAAKTSPDDELTLLLAVGTDTPSDVQILPEGTEPSEPAQPACVSPASLDFAQLAATPDRHGLPGVQPKASATMLTTPLSTLGLRSILKIDPPDYPHLVVNEAAHLNAAGQLKLPVAEHEVVRDSGGVLGLILRRFDRYQGDDGRWHSLAMEDAAQVLGIIPAAKYQVSAEEVVNALAQQATAPLVARRNLYLQTLFAWLTGNGDLHAKKVSILTHRDGNVAVAPICDVPSTVLYGDMTMALPVAGRTWRPCHSRGHR